MLASSWLSTIMTWNNVVLVVTLVPVVTGAEFSHTADQDRTLPPNRRTVAGARLEITSSGWTERPSKLTIGASTVARLLLERLDALMITADSPRIRVSSRLTFSPRISIRPGKFVAS